VTHWILHLSVEWTSEDLYTTGRTFCSGTLAKSYRPHPATSYHPSVLTIPLLSVRAVQQ